VLRERDRDARAEALAAIVGDLEVAFSLAADQSRSRSSA
jgi:hypothetical protein